MDLAHLSFWFQGLIIFGFLFLLLAIGSYVWVALALAGVIGLALFSRGMQGALADIFYWTINSFTFTAVPMYVFLGTFIAKSGLSDSLYSGVSKWTTIMPGSLLQTNIVSCAVFAGVCGSSTAETASFARIAYDEQIKRGYDARTVMGSIAAGGALGILIPPSVIMIIYGDFVNVSIARLFVGGIIPGIIMSLMFVACIVVLHFLHHGRIGPQRDKFTSGYFRNAFRGLVQMWPILLIIITIWGGIYGGVMTPVEAAAVSCSIAIMVAAVYKRLTLTAIKESALEAMKVSGFVIIIVACAVTLGQAVSMVKFPAQLSMWIMSFDLPRMVIWIFVVILYLILGCFLEGASMMLLTLPIVYPILIKDLGFDPIWFGILLTILIEIALVTPPVGLNLFIMQQVSGKSIYDVILGCMPFFVVMCVSLVIFTIWPTLVTFLPSTMYGR